MQLTQAASLKTIKTAFRPDRLIAIGLIIFSVGLAFHLVIKRLLPEPAGTYWKEILLAGLIGLWAIHCLLTRRLWLSDTPLDLAVLVYAGFLLLRFVLDNSGWVGAWGLYISVMYLPLFWLVPLVLRRYPGWITGLLAMLAGVGGVVALGGVLEFILNVPLWPSSETIQRQGFPDVFVYGTHLRRVYFVFDSPTTLANTLALLLPLALVLVFRLRHVWARWAAGLAAALMVTCIILTFSRGIWFATVFSLIAIGLLSLKPHLRQLLFVSLGVLALFGLVWGLVTLFGPGRAPVSTYAGVVELSPSAYQTASLVQVTEELLKAKPAHGERVTHTWDILDPVANKMDTRLVLYEHPPEGGKQEIIYRVTVPPDGALRFAIALAPETWSPEKGDGVNFQVYLAKLEAAPSGQFIFDRYLNPKFNPSDRRWRNFLVNLSPWAGQAVNLSLITESGPTGDWAFDWAGWSDLQIVSLKPNYFAVGEKNTVLRHTSSILDWAEDETNRDRLAAWSMAWNAWQTAPLWGTGLGSTGVAAFHTKPQQAFVTESQVLKALTELGLPGLILLAYLWFQIARVGYQAYKRTNQLDQRILLLGVLASLLIVFVEGWVYQNLEVKQVNAYFWILVGLLAFLAKNTNDEASPLNHSG